VQPLPGVLDHRLFERTTVELGRCDVCGEKKAVYRSREAQANICESCYARLVREWNGREGVR
jgi:formylmethanofuran dehydrogenase subunit E